MNPVCRFLFASSLLAITFLGWHSPEPALVRLEIAHWEKLYQQEKSRTNRGFFLRTRPMPASLDDFIASRTAGQPETSDPVWADFVSTLQQREAAGQPAWFVRNEPPFSDLPRTGNYLAVADGQNVQHIAYSFLFPGDYAEVPGPVAYPLRQHESIPWIVGIIASGLVFWPTRKEIMQRNSAVRGASWSAAIAILSGAVILHPVLHGFGINGQGYAMVVLGGLVALSACLAFFLYCRQIAMLRRMVSGDHLAHFVCDPATWERFTAWNFEQKSSEKTLLWIVVFVLSLIVSLGLMAVKRDTASVQVFGFMMGFCGFLWVVAVALPRVAFRQRLHGPAEAYLGASGIFVSGAVHSWNTWGTRLEAVQFSVSPLPHLSLCYSYLMTAGRTLYFFRNQVVVRVPVPQGKEQEAQELEGLFRKKYIKGA